MNPWTLWQYLHNMIGSVVTGAFVMASVGAFYVLSGKHLEYGKTFLRLGVTAGLIAALLMPFPTGDGQGKNIAQHQPVTLAAMEGLFETTEGAPLALIGQPDVGQRKLDNPLVVPRLLSFLTYQRWMAKVQGLDAFPEDQWPDNIPLLYYSYHIMVGLGTIFIAVMGIAAWKLWRGRLFECRPWLWAILLMLPFPVHRQHRRMADGRGGAAALGDLRIDAHQPGRVDECLLGERDVHADRFHGYVRGVEYPVSVPGAARNRARARTAAAGAAGRTRVRGA